MNVISGNYLIDSIIQDIYNKMVSLLSGDSKKCSVVRYSIDILLPYFSDLHYEDILEIR